MSEEFRESLDCKRGIDAFLQGIKDPAIGALAAMAAGAVAERDEPDPSKRRAIRSGAAMAAAGWMFRTLSEQVRQEGAAPPEPQEEPHERDD